ncbi:MAG: hypothetical protein ACRDLS_16610 [Solirubrobacteraceae bacterium]
MALRPADALRLALVTAIVVGLTAAATAEARMDLPRPVFGTQAEGFGTAAPYECAPKMRAGTRAFADMIRAASGYSYGGARPCNASWGAKRSQHKAGRATDIAINHRNPAQRADGQRLLDWLFEAGADRLRRLGVVEIIWGARIWTTGRDKNNTSPDISSWRRYTGLGCPKADDSACHYDHFHFTLSAAGSEKTSTWWTSLQGFPTPGGPVPIFSTVRFAGITAASSRGYWLVERVGGVFSYGDAQFHGSWGGKPLNGATISIAATPARMGYWLAGTDGGVFAFGDAGFYGSMGGKPLNAPVVGMAASPSGKGYWLVGADGGVFAFGDAGFYGSMGGQALNAPVVGIAATPSGKGYWLVGADGGVFAFGDAGFYGSMGGQALNAPVAGIAATPTGKGYWLVAGDGGVFTFGDAGFYGSLGGQPLNAPVAGIAATPSGKGYWLVGGDGGVFAFGNAPFEGSVPQGSRSTMPAAYEGKDKRSFAVAVTPAIFQPVNPGSPPGGATVTYRSPRSGRVIITVQRRRGGRYVRVRGQKTMRAHRGRNRYLFDGRLRGRRLSPGSYRLKLSIRQGGGRAVIGTDRFKVVR